MLTTTGLTQAVDRAMTKIAPLGEHYAANQDVHVREQYAVLLAAIVLSQCPVSEAQSRLLGMLLASLKLEADLAVIFEQAQNLEEKSLQEAFQLLKTGELNKAMLLDAMILLRLDVPLSEENTALLSELLLALHLSQDDVPVLVYWAARILALDVEVSIPEASMKNLTLTHQKVSAISLSIDSLEKKFSDGVFFNAGVVLLSGLGKKCTSIFGRAIEIAENHDLFSMPFDGVCFDSSEGSGEIKVGKPFCQLLPLGSYAAVWKEFLEMKS